MFISLVLIVFFSCNFVGHSPDEIKVMTYNIRYGTANDGENHWDKRRTYLFDAVKSEECDFIGMQEVLRFQLDELAAVLPDYAYVGRTRDVNDQGEASPIFYLRERWDLLDDGVFWLSETPDKEASIGWDARMPRIATWAKFRNRSSKREIYVYNTHYSHVSENARVRSSKLIKQDLDNRAKASPVILMGDFNAVEESEAITTFSSTLTDTYRLLNKTAPGETAFGWRPHIVGTGKRIDYIFASNAFSVLYANVIDRPVDGRYPSDHNPVVALLKFD